MTNPTGTTTTPPWARLADTRVITAEMVADALTAMELAHTQFLPQQRLVADRLVVVARELGRAEFRRRAQLVIADVTIRQGEIVAGSSLARMVQSEAEQANDAFALARAYFLLAWIAHSIGDLPTAQINGIRSVQLLPDDTARGIVMDHLTILAIAYNPAPEADRYFDEALAIAREYGDPVRTVSILNNIAYAALERGNLQLAQEQVARMLAEAENAGIPLAGAQLDTAARIYSEDGRYDEAIAILAPVAQAADLDEAEVAGLIDTQSHAFPLGLLTLAQAHRGRGELALARRLVGRAEEIARRDGLQGLLAQIAQEQARLHAADGDFQRAFYEYVAFHDAVLELQSEDQAARARIVQASFDAERNRQQAEHFRALAMRDTLTGLFNRRYMDDLLAEAIPAAAAQAEPLSLAIIDADFFKRVNDEHSHKVGDEVLRTLATVMLAVKPDGGTLCRLGGEEFVLVLPGFSAGSAAAGCAAVRVAVAEHDWSPLIGSLPLTVSIGVATAPVGNTSVSALLSDADRNLYAAKRSGRNRVLSDDRRQ